MIQKRRNVTFRCFVNPPNNLFEVKWKILRNSSSHVIDPKDPSVLLPVDAASLGKVSYECQGDASTVHLDKLNQFSISSKYAYCSKFRIISPSDC